MNQIKRIEIIMLSGGHRHVKTHGINIGDLAQLEHARYIITSNLPGAKITLVAHSTNDISPSPDIAYNNYFINYLIGSFDAAFSKAVHLLFQSLKIIFFSKFNNFAQLFLSAKSKTLKMIKDLACKDALIVTGSGTLCDAYWQGPAFIWCVLMICVANLGVPVILLGQQIGPLHNSFARKLIGVALKKAKFVGVRDNQSYDAALSIGVTESKVYFTGDEGFYLNPAKQESVEIFLSEKNIKDNFIAVQFRIDRNCPLAPYVKWFADTLNELSSQYNANLLFIPFFYSNKDDDRSACRSVASHLSVPYQMLEDCTSATLTKGILAKAILAIGVANHFCVFSSSVGVPTIGLYATPYMGQKLQGLQKVNPYVKVIRLTENISTTEFLDNTNAHFSACAKHNNPELYFEKPKEYFNWLNEIKL